MSEAEGAELVAHSRGQTRKGSPRIRPSYGLIEFGRHSVSDPERETIRTHGLIPVLLLNHAAGLLQGLLGRLSLG